MILPRTPSFDLSGRRAIVTGASSGIGLACAAALAQSGATVTLAARRGDVLNDCVARMRAEGWRAEALTFDQSDVAEIEDAFAQPYDIVVNSAGVARHSLAVDATPQDFDTVFDLNVRGAYFLSAAAARALAAVGKPGSIIHISSQMGHVGGVERSIYCASKHAVEGMTKAMAIEWGKANVRINTVCPTFIRTALTESSFDNPERFAWIMDKIKLPRVGEVEDIMGAVLFLASDASAMVTGSAMMIDGGWTAG